MPRHAARRARRVALAGGRSDRKVARAIFEGASAKLEALALINSDIDHYFQTPIKPLNPACAMARRAVSALCTCALLGQTDVTTRTTRRGARQEAGGGTSSSTTTTTRVRACVRACGRELGSKGAIPPRAM